MDPDIDIHVHKSRRYRLGLYAYEVGAACFVLGDYVANYIYCGVHFYDGVRGRLYGSGSVKFLLRLAKLLFGRKAPLGAVADQGWISIDG